MTVPSDRRRPPGRRHARLFVGTTHGAIPFARTRDLSLTGVFLETSARLELGATLEIALAWGEAVLSCQAQVVRIADDGLALTFLDPDTFLLQALQEIMDTEPALAPSPTRP